LILNKLPKRPLKVLDLGGGEGRFTRHLLARLISKEFDIASVTDVDSVDFSTSYQGELDAVLGPNKVIFRRLAIGDVQNPAAGQYDLVIASHSLYSTFDSDTVSNPDVLRMVLSQRRKDGLIVVILASNEGRAYGFKRDGLELAFGETIRDFDAIRFRSLLGMMEVKFKSVIVDDYMDLSALLGPDSCQPEIVEWISYFLRIEKTELTDTVLQELVALLRLYAQPAYQLPEILLEKLESGSFPKPIDRLQTFLLLHKSEVFIL
jgi:SAM-dependent methyltransferase